MHPVLKRMVMRLMRTSLQCAAALCLLAPLTLLPAHAANRTALVIGNGAYAKSPLANPVNDARGMAEALRELGFDVVHEENADERGMKQAVREFTDQLTRKGGVGLFYYAGHAVQVRGRNYLIPVGADVARQADVEFEAVDVGRVLRNMEEAGNGLNLVILDACRDNPFAGEFRSATRGLTRMDAPTGSLIAYSTAPGEVAADGSGKHSPYTEHLLREMRRPAVKVEEVLKRVRIEVMKETRNRQVPWESSSLTGDFYFREGKEPTVAAPGTRPASDAAIELAFWDSIKDSDDPRRFEVYMEE